MSTFSLSLSIEYLNEKHRLWYEKVCLYTATEPSTMFLFEWQTDQVTTTIYNKPTFHCYCQFKIRTRTIRKWFRLKKRRVAHTTLSTQHIQFFIAVNHLRAIFK